MSVICQCPSCHAKYEVGDQYAGRAIKCPKCSSAVGVPAVARPQGPAAVAPKAPASGGMVKAAAAISSKVVTVDQDANGASPIGDEGAFLVGEVTAPPRGTGPAVTEQPPDEDDPVVIGPDNAVSIPGLAARPAHGDHAYRSKKKKKGLPAWAIAAIAAAGAAAFVGIGFAIYLASQPKPGSGSSADSTAPGAKKTVPAAAGPKGPVLTIDWPENQRARASLLINEEKKELPLTGPIVIPLPPSDKQYTVRLQRSGFDDQVFFVASLGDDVRRRAAEWTPVVHGIDWAQDFEVAKKTAATERKSVFLLFDASDSKQSRAASDRFAEAVARRQEFRERADREYVCVYINNPEKEEARSRVENADRNQKLTKKFRIAVFPTVVVTDPKGRPFGILEDYKINGITPFLALMGKWEADGKHLFAMLAKIDAKIDAKPAENPDPELIGMFFDFLEMNDLDRFYRGYIKDLTAMLPDGDRLVTDEVADMWEQKLHLASVNPDAAKRVVDAFDQWKKKKTRTFKDHEKGAKLHLWAAFILLHLGSEHQKQAVQECKEGMAYDPHEPMVRSLLQAIAGGGLVPGSSGTGFCVAQGNYILTNHHVIRGAKEIKVHLNGEQKRYSANVVDVDEAGDMALLKVNDLPAGKDLAPVPLAATGVAIGEDVCVMGFPGVMSQNSTLTFTKGVVSTVPDPHDEKGVIATDCKVNPGNSGGPLCNFSGGIAGMVTRKSEINSMEDSYGLVIPVDRLRKFLMEKLPRGSRTLPPSPTGPANLKADELGRKLAPSVVYIENLQDMRSLVQGE